MSDKLYPDFPVPIAQQQDPETQPYLPAPMFDFEAGDFVRDGANRIVMCDGHEAYREWCLKVLNTQLGASMAYVGIGIDGERAMAQPTRQATESHITRSITEALSMHPGTQRVKDFRFEWESDALHVSFTIDAKDMASFDINMNITN